VRRRPPMRQRASRERVAAHWAIASKLRAPARPAPVARATLETTAWRTPRGLRGSVTVRRRSSRPPAPSRGTRWTASIGGAALRGRWTGGGQGAASHRAAAGCRGRTNTRFGWPGATVPAPAPAEAAGLAQPAPPGGPGARAAGAGPVDEGLPQPEGMPVARLPVGAEPLDVQRERLRGEVREPDAGQAEDPHGVRHPVQAARLERRVPAQPGVARAAREGGGGPGEERHPGAVEGGDIGEARQSHTRARCSDRAWRPPAGCAAIRRRICARSSAVTAREAARRIEGAAEGSRRQVLAPTVAKEKRKVQSKS
jgi:hypothetical protein